MRCWVANRFFLFVIFFFVVTPLFAADQEGWLGYQNRGVDPGSKVRISASGEAFGRPFYEISISHVNLIQPGGARSHDSVLHIRIFADALSKSGLRDDLATVSVATTGVTLNEGDYVWSLPISRVLDEMEFMNAHSPPTFSSHLLAGHWRWDRGDDGCFDTYVFDDNNEFSLVQGNSITTGTYVIKELAKGARYEIFLSVSDRYPGDLSCGENWLEKMAAAEFSIIARYEAREKKLYILPAQGHGKALGPFYNVYK